MSQNPNSTNSQSVFETFFSFDVKYAGLIPDIPADMDLTGRTDILRIIDGAKKDKNIPYQLTSENDAIMLLNAYSLRVMAKLDEELLLCVPVHMLAAIGFVREDSLNILTVKIGEVGGNKEICDLAVVYCDTAKQAEEISDIMSQCFQAVFTEATSQYFDKRLVEGSLRDANLTLLNLGGGGGEPDDALDSNEPSSYAEGSSRSDFRPRGQQRHFLHQSSMATTTQSESDQFSAYAAEQIQNYMQMLHVALSAEELKQFAVLLKRWRSENLPFPEFCQKVSELYGAERKNLLAGMKPFIPDKELAYFETFLDQSNGAAADPLSMSAAVSTTVELHAPRKTLTVPEEAEAEVEESRL